MTSNNALKNRIIDKIIELLVNLYSFGFSEPVISHEDWSTTVTFMLSNIALEVEIDWRDFDIFILIVRLENGALPNGYYVSEGMPCRYHLQKVITDRKWSVDQNALAMISQGKKGKRQNSKQSEDAMLDRFCVYKKVLDSCIDKLVDENEMIFKG